jgi:hypothetical protein
VSPEPKSRSGQSLFLDVLRSETISGSEDLAAWIRQFRSQSDLENLFRLEAWLRGMRTFFSADHIPLSEGEKSELVSRAFASEIEIFRQAIQRCEACAQQAVLPDISGKFKLEKYIESQMCKDSFQDLSAGRIAEQRTPGDSVSRLLEFLNDFRITLDALRDPGRMNYQLFLCLGRLFDRELKNCRYIDLLISQKLRIQFDLIDNKLIAGVLDRIPAKKERRNTALLLLYLFRLLKYLNLVLADLKQDRPLKADLVLFSLLHKEIGEISDFLRTRFLRQVEAESTLRNAAELVAYSLKMEARRVLDRELIFIQREMDPALVYSKVENAHGLLRNCCQSCILTMLLSIDKNFDAAALFPSRRERLLEGEKLRKDLWELRRWLMDILDNRKELDSDEIIIRLHDFKDASLHSLMYRDWAEFDAFLEALTVSGNFIEIRTHIRKFTGFLEMLIQEISKRSVSQRKRPSLNIA